LTAWVSHTSCKCTSASVASKEVQPGEKGTLLASVDLTTHRGVFGENVQVGSNDPDHPFTTLVFCGGVLNNLVSARAIHWGSVRAGQTLTRRFVVYDPGEGKLRVDEATWESAPTRSGDPLRCRVTTQRATGTSNFDNLSPPVKVHDGDYVIGVEVDIPENAPPGKAGGDVWVKTNLPGKWSRFSVSLEGQILSDLEASPAALVLSSADLSRQETVRVRSVLGKALEVEKVDVTGGVPVRVGAIRPGKDGSTEVQVQAVSAAPGQPQEGTLVCRLRGGRSLGIPVVILNTGARK
jgi:hypothetical protein